MAFANEASGGYLLHAPLLWLSLRLTDHAFNRIEHGLLRFIGRCHNHFIYKVPQPVPLVLRAAMITMMISGTDGLSRLSSRAICSRRKATIELHITIASKSCLAANSRIRGASLVVTT
jgi:hypothetical protein